MTEPSLYERTTEIMKEVAAHLDTQKKPLHADFPRGWIRSLNLLRSRWPYLPRHRARTVACAIQLCDVNRFYLSAFKLSLTAGSMWEWHVTLPVVAVIETLSYEVVRNENWGDENVRFEKCINILHSRGIFRHPFQIELHKLRKYRNEVHLHLKEKVEMHNGRPEEYNKAVKALHNVERLLNEHFGYEK